jgi:MFS family permease
MKSRYRIGRPVVPWRYLSGAASARAGDEMSGPALLLFGLAATGRPAAGSELLASVTIAAAAGGPMFGALLDRSRRPARMQAATLAAYVLGLAAIQAALGQVPMPLVVLVALACGLFNPAVAGGWSSQLPRLVPAADLSRGSALDAMTYSVASLAGPALAALIAAGVGARWAVLAAAALVALAVPAALTLPGPGPSDGRPSSPSPHRQVAVHRQMAAGFAEIVARRPLLRATATSVVSYVGIGMLLVCCPLLGAQRLGAPARGALLISAMAAASLAANAILARRPWRAAPDTAILVSTLVIGAGMAAAAVAPGWLVLLAVAVSGAGEGPQVTALFAVRHREAPEHMRAQIFTTAASVKIGGLAAGAALAGPLAGRSVVICLLIAAGTQACATATYLLTGPGRTVEPRPPAGSASRDTGRGATARSV